MKTFCFILLIANFLTVNAQVTAIADSNFEQQLITLGIDTNGLNGTILNSDASAVTTLNITGTAITNFGGLEAFINVITLNLGGNSFASLPLGSLTNLESLKFTSNDYLSSLDFSANTQLKILDIQSNIFSTTNVPSISILDLSVNTNLEEFRIRDFINLNNLILPVTSTLKRVWIYDIADPTLDFSLIASVENLTLSGTYATSVAITLPTLTTNLKTFLLNNITTIDVDVSPYINLEFLGIQTALVETVTLPATNTLINISILNHNLQGIVDFSAVANLRQLTINTNLSTPLQIDISQCLLLQQLTLLRNDMITLDVSQNSMLEFLRLNHNNFTSLNLTQNVALKYLEADYNFLPTIDLSQNVALEQLSARFNVITTLDLSQNIALYFLYVNNNLLPTLNITSNAALQIVDISNNLFSGTGLDLTQNINLYNLTASNNQIESLNILQTVKLAILIIDHNLFSGTSILDQFYVVRQNDGDIRTGRLDVSFNILSGMMPNFSGLFHKGEGGIGDWTSLFSLIFNNNNFEFGHFEAQHSEYVLALTTIGPAPFNSPVMETYRYAPQAKVNNIDTINATAGDPVSFTTIVSGAENHYLWFKDGVQIVGAADSPNFNLASANSCDAGVYYCEVLSDLVPFENSSPPGTSGKNLKLIRNDITLNVDYIPSCVTLLYPLNGAIDIPINSNLIWSSIAAACGYYLSVGTTAGGTDIADNIDVGDVTTYNLGSNLPSSTQIYVTLIPYFQSGVVLTCASESFTTNTSVSTPVCTSLLSPLDNSISVSLNSTISWSASANATGYFISYGSNAAANNIANMIDLGNVLTYNPAVDFPANTIIYVSIIPYNSAGNAVGCAVESFTTEEIEIIIPKFFTPNNDGTNDVWKISDSKNQVRAIYIFDRYGKHIYTIPNNLGYWDGKYANKKLPSSDYWYVIEKRNGTSVSGHFSLKR